MIEINNFKLRQAYYNDIEKIVSIGRKTFVQTYFDHFKNDFSLDALDAYVDSAFSVPRIENEYADANAKFFILQRDSEVLGYCKVKGISVLGSGSGNSVLTIERIYLDQSVQRQGIGLKILDYIFQLAKDNQKTAVRLQCWENHYTTLSFYSSHGFRIVDKTTFQMESTPFHDTDVILEKSID
jgi:GNAT superfamily N-acetyltransferase